MAHFGYIEDDQGELVDILITCSDSCNRTAHKRIGEQYEGWSGCHELEFGQPCENCGVWISGFEDDYCREQLGNVVVNRFRVDKTTYCDEHGTHVLQLEERNLLP